MSVPNQLLLDLTSPLPSLDDAQLRAWARGRTVMISSTMRDLKDERETVAEAVSSIGATSRYFEHFSSPADPAQVYQPEVDRADIYLFLAGERYGEPVPGDSQRRSATHLEYDTAYTSYKSVLAYNKTGTQREPALTTFVSQLEGLHTVTRFSTLEELRRAVLVGLRGLAEAQSTIWVKLGQAVFPAQHMTFPPASNAGHALDPRQQRQSATLTASLRDPQILAVLPGTFHARPFTLTQRVFDASEVRVHQEESGRFAIHQRIEADLRPATVQPLSVIPITNGESAEEQLAVALDSLLFGRVRPQPHYNATPSFLRELPPIGPLLARLHQQLQAHHREAELFVPMAELLLTDALLLGTPQAPAPLTSLERLEVSPVIQDRLFVRLAGEHRDTSFGGRYRIEREGYIDFQAPALTGITGW